MYGPPAAVFSLCPRRMQKFQSLTSLARSLIASVQAAKDSLDADAGGAHMDTDALRAAIRARLAVRRPCHCAWLMLLHLLHP